MDAILRGRYVLKVLKCASKEYKADYLKRNPFIRESYLNYYSRNQLLALPIRKPSSISNKN